MVQLHELVMMGLRNPVTDLVVCSILKRNDHG